MGTADIVLNPELYKSIESICQTFYCYVQQTFPKSKLTIVLIVPLEGTVIFKVPMDQVGGGKHDFGWFMQYAEKNDVMEGQLVTQLDSVPYTISYRQGCQYWMMQTLQQQFFGLVSLSGMTNLEKRKVSRQINKLAYQLLPYVLHVQLSLYDRPNRVYDEFSGLSVLYETSYELGQALSYPHIIMLMFKSLIKVLKIDVFAIFLLESSKSEELVMWLTKPMNEKIVKGVQDNILKNMEAVSGMKINSNRVNVVRQIHYDPMKTKAVVHEIHSFVNAPLVFRDQVLGIVTLSTHVRDAYSQNDFTFLQTMANQIASHFWRLKAVKDSEKTKIASMLGSMTEGVLMLDDQNRVEIFNDSAKTLLRLTGKMSSKILLKRFEEIGMMEPLASSVLEGEKVTDKELVYNGRILSANVAPVTGVDKTPLGTVLVVRDVTKVRQIQRLNEQRLAIIEKVTNVLTSITDLNGLLSVLLDLILSICHAQMGSIQLKQGPEFVTQIHTNFPDKIRCDYQFTSGQTISDYVIETKQLCVIHDYQNTVKVKHDTKISIDSYVCVPIIRQKTLIGLVHVVKKAQRQKSILIQSDIDTLVTVTELSAVAIQNATLIEETIATQKLEQEVKVAFTIQKQLLPARLPNLGHIQFGAMFKPAAVIGGDYYDFFKLDNGCVGIVIADIVGKGVPAALFMVMFKTLMQMSVRHYTQPKTLFNQLNTLIVEDSLFTRFVPVFYGLLNPETYEFWYCNAGHEPPIWFHKNTNRALVADQPPLGVDRKTEYSEKKIILEQQDVICFFTDGLIEARGAKKKVYGNQRLKRLIKKHHRQPAQILTNHIYDHVTRFSKGYPQHDDVTIVVLSCHPVQPEVLKKTCSVETFFVSSHKKNISVVREKIHKIVQSMEFSSMACFDIKLAINEAHTNIIEHVYLGRETDKIYFRIKQFSDRLVVVIKDTGKKTSGSFLDQRDDVPLCHLEGSGLGVFLMRQLMDDVQFHQTKLGGVLTMMKFIVKS